MAPQKRKYSHDASQDRPTQVPQVTTRRSTRQHPDVGAAADHQLRSGRIRTNNTDEAPTSTMKDPVPRPRKRDASKEAEHPTTAMKQTRTARQRVVSEPGRTVVAALSPTSRENMPPQSAPDDRRQRMAPPPKQTRHHALHSGPNTDPDLNTRKRSRSHSDSLSKPRERVTSPPTPHALVARPSRQSARPIPAATGSGPAHVAGAATLTPKRTPQASSKTPRPPGTPHSDRNIDTVVFGSICFKAWYPSYYGKEVLGDDFAHVGGFSSKVGGAKRDQPLLDRLYICPCCFKYSRELLPWWKHVGNCEKRASVPGTKIYTHPHRATAVGTAKAGSSLASPPGAAKPRGRHKTSEATNSEIVNEGEWSVWEVDGEKEGLFCQNLSLFAKLFLDNKSVFFDVSGFNYFLLVYTPSSETHAASSAPAGPASNPTAKAEHSQSNSSDTNTIGPTSFAPPPRPQIVGFFSKEKISWDNNNLACILIFPPWQRKGLGALLMGISYEISRREGVLGGPEKPISELGRKGYKRFWAGEIVRWILELPTPPPSSSNESSHSTRHPRREKDREKGLVVDIEQCSRETWIVPEDCLAVLREMGVVEEAGLGPPRGERAREDDETTDASTQGKVKEEKESKSSTLVPTVRINKAAVRVWALDNKVNLTRACDPDGFVAGYAVKQAENEGD